MDYGLHWCQKVQQEQTMKNVLCLFFNTPILLWKRNVCFYLHDSNSYKYVGSRGANSYVGSSGTTDKIF